MNDNFEYKVGIAGYGVVGKRRRHFIDLHPRMRTVAVCDQTFTSSGTVSDGVKCYSNYKQLLEEPLDILFVCIANYVAAEVTIGGLARGLHVFCEKPPGTSVAEIEQICEVEAQHPELCLRYGFNHRYHDSVREALRVVRSNELGNVLSVRGVYGKSKIIPFSGGWRAQRKYAGGGILLDQGVHMLDLMRLFCGDFVEIKSFVSNSFWGHDVEDNAYALLKDAHGRVAMLQSSATQWQHRFNMEITLDAGYLELRGILSGSKSYGQETLVVGKRDEADTGASAETVLTYLEDNSWRDEIDEFAAAVGNGAEVGLGTSSDALAIMKLVFGIYWADPAWREAHDIPRPADAGPK